MFVTKEKDNIAEIEMRYECLVCKRIRKNNFRIRQIHIVLFQNNF